MRCSPGLARRSRLAWRMRWSPIGSRARRSTIPTSTRSTPTLVPGILRKFGGKILARGGNFKILEGPEKFHRFIVIEFASFEKAVACHESPQYLEAAAHRKKDGAGELEIVIVESI